MDTTDAWQDGKLILSLNKSIMTEDGEMKSITLREPTGADQMACGNPVIFNPMSDPPSVQIKDREMGAMLSRLSNLSPVAIGRMSPKDMTMAGWALVPFFVPV